MSMHVVVVVTAVVVASIYYAYWYYTHIFLRRKRGHKPDYVYVHLHLDSIQHHWVTLVGTTLMLPPVLGPISTTGYIKIKQDGIGYHRVIFSDGWFDDDEHNALTTEIQSLGPHESVFLMYTVVYPGVLHIAHYDFI